MKAATQSFGRADTLAAAPAALAEGEGDSGGANPIPSNVLGVAIFIAAEVMLFGGLLSAFMILRAESAQWPPVGQPRLPLAITTVNSIVLFTSAWMMLGAARAIGKGDRRTLIDRLSLTLILGASFLLVQGVEWIRLIRFGLSVSSSIYGGLFYTLVGVHAVHVMGAVAALCVVLRLARRGRYSRHEYSGVVACALYWCFVVVLWGVIYGTIYLG